MDLRLMDEASSALDAINREHIQNLILKLYKKNPTTMVVVTHSIEEAVFLGQTDYWCRNLAMYPKASGKRKQDGGTLRGRKQQNNDMIRQVYLEHLGILKRLY